MGIDFITLISGPAAQRVAAVLRASAEATTDIRL